jgi:hypothetical protein
MIESFVLGNVTVKVNREVHPDLARVSASGSNPDNYIVIFAITDKSRLAGLANNHFNNISGPLVLEMNAANVMTLHNEVCPPILVRNPDWGGYTHD